MPATKNSRAKSAAAVAAASTPNPAAAAFATGERDGVRPAEAGGSDATERSLRAALQRLDFAMAAAQMGEWQWDAKTDSLELTGTAAAIVGIPSGSRVSRAAMRALLHPDDLERTREIVQTAMAARTDYDMEYRLQQPSGVYAWVAVRGRGIFDDEGEIIGAGGVMQEITKRKEAEERQRAQETQLRVLSSNAPVILSHWSREHRLLFASRAFADRWQVSVESLLGKTVPEVLGHHAWEAIRAYVERTLAGEMVTFEMEVPYDGIGRRYVRVCYSPELDASGKVTGYFSAVSDITDRRRAELALKESEERLRLATQTGKVGLWDWDVLNNHITWTDSLYEIHGVNPREFDATVEGFSALVFPADRAIVAQSIQASLAAPERPYEIEFRAVRPDGQIIWLFTNAVVLREGGRPVRMLGATLDITARKRAELALRASDEKFRALARHAPVGIFMSAPDGGCVFVNECWCTITGLTPEAATGEGWTRALHPDDRHRIVSEWAAAAAAGRSFAAEFRFLRPDAHVAWVQVSAVEFRDAAAAPLGYIGTVIDITERKTTEFALRESEKRFRTVASRAPVGIFMTDPAGETVFVNETWCNLAGLTPEQARGRGWVRAVHPEDRARLQTNWDSAVNGAAGSSEEFRFLRADGSVAWVQGSAVQLRDPSGRLGGYVGTVADFTARKLAEEEVRKHAQHLSLAVAAAKLGDWSWDPVTDVLTFSPRGAEIFGVAGQRGLTRTQLRDLLHPDDRERARLANEQAIASKTDYDIEYRLRRPSGEWGWIAAKGRGVYAPDGRLVSMLGVVQDITARREIEAALRESEERFRLLADNIAQFAWITDAAGRRQWINRRFVEYTGLSVEDINSGKGVGLLHPEHATRVQEKFRAHLVSGEPWEDVFPYRGKDGAYRWFLSRAVPIRDAQGAVSRWFGTNTDITDLRTADAALQKQNERLRLISEALASLIDATDPAAVVRELLPRAARHLEADAYFNYMVDASGGVLRMHASGGIEPEIAKSIERLEFGQAICGTVAQTGRPIHATDIQNSIDEKSALVRGFGIQAYACNPFVVDNRLLGTLSFASRQRPSFALDELEFMASISRYVALAIDRARAQTRLREHALELERTVEQRTASLREAIAQMEEFSYSVSHDLRSPLRAMNAYAEALVEDYGPQLDETARGYLERIQRSSLRMEKLTHDVLTYSRLARAEMQLGPVDLGRLLRDLIDQYAELQPANADVEIAVPLQPVLANESSLGQCLGNLLTNAAKFVRPGERPRIRVRTEPAGERVRIWVEDDGIGIPPEYHMALFQVFERVPTRAHYEGTGIGLAIVRKAAEKMGGRAGVESDGSRGSRFWVELKKA